MHSHLVTINLREVFLSEKRFIGNPKQFTNLRLINNVIPIDLFFDQGTILLHEMLQNTISIFFVNLFPGWHISSGHRVDCWRYLNRLRLRTYWLGKNILDLLLKSQRTDLCWFRNAVMKGGIPISSEFGYFQFFDHFGLLRRERQKPDGRFLTIMEKLI